MSAPLRLLAAVLVLSGVAAQPTPPNPVTSEYVTTRFAGFEFVQSSSQARYVVEFELSEPYSPALKISVEFENPTGAPAVFISVPDLAPGEKSFQLKSPLLPAIENGATYNVVVKGVSAGDGSALFEHTQPVLFYLPVDDRRTSLYVPPEEDWSIPIDPSGWKIGNRQRTPDLALVEYVRREEDIRSWSELLTTLVIFHSGRRLTVGEVASRTEEGLRRGCPELVWSVERESSTEVVYEWRHNGCQGFPAQHQIARLIAGRFGVHSLAYVRKTSELSSSDRERWITAISRARLKAPAPSPALELP